MGFLRNLTKKVFVFRFARFGNFVLATAGLFRSDLRNSDD